MHLIFTVFYCGFNVSKLTVIGSDNGLSSRWCQVTIRTNVSIRDEMSCIMIWVCYVAGNGSEIMWLNYATVIMIAFDDASRYVVNNINCCRFVIGASKNPYECGLVCCVTSCIAWRHFLSLKGTTWRNNGGSTWRNRCFDHDVGFFKSKLAFTPRATIACYNWVLDPSCGFYCHNIHEHVQTVCPIPRPTPSGLALDVRIFSHAFWQ